MTATFVSVCFSGRGIRSSLALRLPLHPPAATQLMFSQAHTGYQLLYQQICFSRLFLSSSNQFLEGLLLSLVSTNAIDPSHNWDLYPGTLTLSQRVSNTNPAPPAGPLILQISPQRCDNDISLLNLVEQTALPIYRRAQTARFKDALQARRRALLHVHFKIRACIWRTPCTKSPTN